MMSLFTRFKKALPRYGKSSIGLSKPPSITVIRIMCESLKIFLEVFRGLVFLRRYRLSASFFGSAREVLDNYYYEEAEKLAGILSKKGFSIITGGAGGIMRAANRGAYRMNGDSAGVNIFLPEEQIINKFVHNSITLKYFFVRKTVLSCAAEVYIFFPGGYGTLDELFELLTLIQTKRSEFVPILLVGKDFWNPLVTIIENHLAKKYKTISTSDVSLLTLVDSADEAERYIEQIGSVINTRLCKYSL